MPLPFIWLGPYEILGTRGLVGLDRTFTAELWMKGRLRGDNVLLGDMVEETFSGAGNQLVGWSLVLSDATSSRLAIEYAGGPRSAARIVSREIVAASRRPDMNSHGGKQ